MSLYPPIILTDCNKPWEQALPQGVPVLLTDKRVLSASAVYGDAGGMYFIRSGFIRLSHIFRNGEEKAMLYMGRGTLFAEVPMFHAIPSQEHIFTAMETTETVFLPKRLVSQQFIRDNPLLMLNLLQSLSIKAANFYFQICYGHGYDSFTIVCRALYSFYLYSRVGRIAVPHLPQQELAAFLGFHRCTLHRALSRLYDEGIIGRYSKKSLPVYKPDVLLRYAETLERV